MGTLSFPSLFRFSLWTLFAVLVFSGYSRAINLPDNFSLDRNTGGEELRGSIVSFANEADLSDLLVSIYQLEENFNVCNQYHWVFFSTTSLSEEFRRITSNATQAQCLYEVIDPKHWGRQPSPSGDQDSVAGSQEIVKPDNGTVFGTLVLESRMKYYDWAWVIEPGTRFHQRDPFDVFRFMQDNRIAYGSTRSRITGPTPGVVPSLIKAVTGQDPALVFEEPRARVKSHVSHEKHEAFQSSGHNTCDDGVWTHSIQENTIAVVERENASCPGGNCQQGGLFAKLGLESGGQDEEDMKNPAVDFYMDWLHGACDSSSNPTFEVGSLAFFRTARNGATTEKIKVLLQDEIASPVMIRDAPTRSVDASTYLSQGRILKSRRMLRAQVAVDVGVVALWPTASYLDINPKEAGIPRGTIEEQWYMWDMMAKDMNRQAIEPALMSGSTAIDERTLVTYILLKGGVHLYHAMTWLKKNECASLA